MKPIWQFSSFKNVFSTLIIANTFNQLFSTVDFKQVLTLFRKANDLSPEQFVQTNFDP